jgi:hypothetical protein
MKRSAIMLLTLAAFGLTACQGAFDPWQRPGDWQVTGAANETIAQQAANKGDLIKGTDSPTTSGAAAVTGLGAGTGVAPAVTGASTN